MDARVGDEVADEVELIDSVVVEDDDNGTSVIGGFVVRAGPPGAVETLIVKRVVDVWVSMDEVADNDLELDGVVDCVLVEVGDFSLVVV